MTISKAFQISSYFSETSSIYQIAEGTKPISITTYQNISDLPLSNSIPVGERAFVTENNRLYFYNGSGWYSFSLINESPVLDSAPNASYVLDSYGLSNPTIIQYLASDPEGLPLTYSYIASDSAQYFASISNDSSIYTIQALPTETIQSYDSGGGSFDLTFKVQDNIGNFVTSTSSFSILFAGPEPVLDQEFSYTGASQTYTIPAGTNYIYAKIWGGAGGGPKSTDVGPSYGGAGGYAYGKIDVSSFTSITVYVGQGGVNGPSNNGLSFGFGGGGNGEGGGQGGGGSAVVANDGTVLLVAGGGGGAGARDTVAGIINGGAGGGQVGQDGSGDTEGGPGANGANPGIAINSGFDGGAPGTGSNGGGDGGAAGGGTGDSGGGAGGGGYAGGAGGGGGTEAREAGGGGGSGYYNPTYVTDFELTTGVDQTPANSDDVTRPIGVAEGGGPGVSGGNGYVGIYR